MQTTETNNMNEANPIDLLFGGMEKLGPGSNSDTQKVLNMLPREDYEVIVDAGCGTGRQTLALAKRLQTLVHAVDSYEPFLVSLEQRAREARIEHLVQLMLFVFGVGHGVPVIPIATFSRAVGGQIEMW
jgi:tRNA G46 methylase TrmB